jgi:hypothetical protein
MIELTEEQRRAVRSGEAIRVLDADLGGTIVLLREESYCRLQDALEEAEDRKEQAAFLRASHTAAVAAMKENPY